MNHHGHSYCGPRRDESAPIVLCKASIIDCAQELIAALIDPCRPWKIFELFLDESS